MYFFYVILFLYFLFRLYTIIFSKQTKVINAFTHFKILNLQECKLQHTQFSSEEEDEEYEEDEYEEEEEEEDEYEEDEEEEDDEEDEEEDEDEDKEEDNDEEDNDEEEYKVKLTQIKELLKEKEDEKYEFNKKNE